MKTNFRITIGQIVTACFILLALTLPSQTHSQTLTAIKSFGGVLTNEFGFHPQSGLVQGPDGTMYGETSSGEGLAGGSLFKFNSNGAGFAVLKVFTNYTLEGGNPTGGLLLSGDTLYGVTPGGGTSYVGTVFKIQTDGSGYTVLKNFTGTDGAYPNSALALSGETLYGTTQGGGPTYTNDGGFGTVFKLKTDGSGFVSLHSFFALAPGPYTNEGGASPGAVISSGSTLYGTASGGGSGGGGTVFALNTDGSGFMVLKNFTNQCCSGPNEGSPTSGLLLSGGTLYGSTSTLIFKLNMDGTGFTAFNRGYTGDYSNSGNGGPLLISGNTLYASGNPTNSYPAIFRLNTDFTGFSLVKDFQAYGSGTPKSGFVLSGSTLFGITEDGGMTSQGTVFKVDTNGANYGVLKNFFPSDGIQPQAGLIASSNVLYGTTPRGGSDGRGTVFKVNPDGTGYTVLRNCNTNDLSPGAALVSDATNLFGTTRNGGSNGRGAVFKLKTDGTDFTVLKSFALDTNGYWPATELVLAGGTLYGTTGAAGNNYLGTVFRINTDGTSFSLVKRFTNSLEGLIISGGLILSGSTLYGTCEHGGIDDDPSSGVGFGTIFKVNTNGTGFAVLKRFPYLSTTYPRTNSDGAFPTARLTLSGNALYGTASGGGPFASGTIFKINTDGSGFAVLKALSATTNDQFGVTLNSDGANPQAGLILSGNTLYGATPIGGSHGGGTLFKINTNGTDFTVMVNLEYYYYSPGRNPQGWLLLLGNALYGTAEFGGEFNDYGSVLKVDLAPTLSATLLPGGLPQITVTSFLGQTAAVQTATELVPPNLTVWTMLTNLVLTNGVGQFTDMPNLPRRFYRAVAPAP
jgi:uncharacterized repeat protein (TIGR03803 family)